MLPQEGPECTRGSPGRMAIPSICDAAAKDRAPNPEEEDQASTDDVRWAPNGSDTSKASNGSHHGSRDWLGLEIQCDSDDHSPVWASRPRTSDLTRGQWSVADPGVEV